MCIIAFKPAGTAPLAQETLKNCWDNNRDGAGIMYVAPGAKGGPVVHILKGFMSWNDFLEAYTALNFGEESIMAAHFRIATSGGVRKANCHPFPVKSKEKLLRKTSLETDLGVMHNGVFGAGRGDLSDTMLFARDTLSHPFLRNALMGGDQEALNFLGEQTTGSRLLLFTNSGRSMRTGTWIEDKGHFFSNSNFREVSWKNWGSAGMYGAFDDDYDIPGYASTTIKAHKALTGGRATKKLALPLPLDAEEDDQDDEGTFCPNCGDTCRHTAGRSWLCETCFREYDYDDTLTAEEAEAFHGYLEDAETPIIDPLYPICPSCGADKGVRNNGTRKNPFYYCRTCGADFDENGEIAEAYPEGGI